MRLQQCVRDEAPKRPPRTLSGGVIENVELLQNLGNNHIFGLNVLCRRNAVDAFVQSIPIAL